MTGGLFRLLSYGAQDVYILMQPSNITRHVICLDYLLYNSTMMKSSECAICLEEFDTSSKVHITDCNHEFHYNCIYQYLEKIDQCHYNYPLCRKKIDIIRK